MNINSTNLTVRMDRDYALRAEFRTVELDVTSDPPLGGMVFRNPPGFNYPPGTTVTLDARPSAGFGFIGWSGSVTSRQNPLTLTLTQNLSLVAKFGTFVLHLTKVGVSNVIILLQGPLETPLQLEYANRLEGPWLPVTPQTVGGKAVVWHATSPGIRQQYFRALVADGK